MRMKLWPDASKNEHLKEMSEFLEQPDRYSQLIALSSAGMPIGFAEGGIRHEYVNGTSSSPVVYLEGIFVHENTRQQNVARQLASEIEKWGKSKGCLEFASDADLDNDISQKFHRAIGFEETERVVYFRKSLSEK